MWRKQRKARLKASFNTRIPYISIRGFEAFHSRISGAVISPDHWSWKKSLHWDLHWELWDEGRLDQPRANGWVKNSTENTPRPWRLQDESENRQWNSFREFLIRAVAAQLAESRAITQQGEALNSSSLRAELLGASALRVPPASASRQLPSQTMHCIARNNAFAPAPERHDIVPNGKEKGFEAFAMLLGHGLEVYDVTEVRFWLTCVWTWPMRDRIWKI